MIYPYQGKYPTIHPSVFLTDDVTIIGDVTLEEDTSAWFGTIIRGDVHYIRIGARTNIQDRCVLHVTGEGYPLIIGSDVTIGHGAILHGSTIHEGCLIGMGARILDGANIGKQALVAAGALVTQHFEVPDGMLVAGVPAKVIRPLTAKEKTYGAKSAENYKRYVSEYRKHQDLEKGISNEEYLKKR